jgi:thiosulfate/3-mercaptopyruvate sulfurtransferase
MHQIAYYRTNKVSSNQIIDARSEERFSGLVDEPRPIEGLRRGHISGSINLPYTELFDK